MPTELTSGLSVDDYLDRAFDPECELPGGETKRKPPGTVKHSPMQRRLLRLLEAAFGEVPFCWVIDPVDCRAWEYHRGAESREAAGTLPEPCTLLLSEVFAA